MLEGRIVNTPTVFQLLTARIEKVAMSCDQDDALSPLTTEMEPFVLGKGKDTDIQTSRHPDIQEVPPVLPPKGSRWRIDSVQLPSPVAGSSGLMNLHHRT